MRAKVMLLGALAISIVLCTMPSLAQNVSYSGTLRIGFGDSDNPADLSNNGIPVCAATNPFVKQTFATLVVNGQATQAAGGGAGAALTFQGRKSGNGGAQIKTIGTCEIQLTPFVDPRFRSRTQLSHANWPSDNGPYQGTGMTPNPVTTQTWMLGAGLGNQSFTGNSTTVPLPFFGTGLGQVRITKGAATYGGGNPYEGGGAVQLGANTTIMQLGGGDVTDFAQVPYANGFLPTDPQLFGTDAKGAFGSGTTTNFPHGMIAGSIRPFALRSPGGSTIDQQGKILTLAGGNTVTPNTAVPTSQQVPLISPISIAAAYFEWTTGRVQHTDMVGDFVTMRTATGLDAATTGPNGTTRRLQLVTPFSATIKGVGPFGIFPLPLGFGGLGVLDLKIIPVPEPGSLAMLGFGVAGVIGLGAAKRRNG